MARRAALFDLDRTLVRRETAGLFIRYQRDRGEATFRDALRVAWWVLQYTLGVIDAPRVAERALASLAGRDEGEFMRSCEDWFRRYVRQHLAEGGRRAVDRHRRNGEFVVIVTGASPYAAWPVARELGIEHVVATELEVVDGRFTGKPRYPLCYGHGKLLRASQMGDRLGFALAEASFYSDSATDLPLFERVARPVAINPDLRLRWIARRRGWPIERW
ncbi:MAG: HAD family hydrolase [Deltaproteobacteria bacterium]|nr:HAD family hydrolase [Deltaproteobacteria bacterium]